MTLLFNKLTRIGDLRLQCQIVQEVQVIVGLYKVKALRIVFQKETKTRG